MKIKEEDTKRICNQCKSKCKTIIKTFIFKADEKKDICIKCGYEHCDYEICLKKTKCCYCKDDIISTSYHSACIKCEKIVNETDNDKSLLFEECDFYYDNYNGLDKKWLIKVRDTLYNKLIKIDIKNDKLEKKTFNNMKNKLENLK